MPNQARRSGSKGGSPATDRAALVALYKTAHGDFWYRDYNGRPDDEYGPPPEEDYPTWLSAAPLDRWHGVETNTAGRVIVLDLNYATDDRFLPPPYEYSGEPPGSIPAELGNLDQLERLDLNGNYLHGSIPAELGNLTRLRELHLAGNQLSGSIPAELGRLNQLEWLDLSNNQLSGSIPAELGNLDQLKVLDLSENFLSGLIPAELGRLDQLKVLDLSNNLGDND